VERSGGADSTFAWRGRVPAGATLRVFNVTGPVDVREATGGEVEVRAEKLPGRGRLEDMSFEVRRTGDDVTICSLWRDTTRCDDDGIRNERGHDGSRQVRVAFTVLVPRGVRLHVASGNGEVSVRDAGADVSAASGNGRVRVLTAAGEVRASSGNGDIEVDGAGGRVTASTGNGRVRVLTAAGPVSATSGNGNIDVRMSTLRAEGDMRFTTGNGTVTVSVPDGFEADVETNQGSGEFRSDFPVTLSGRLSPHRVRGTIGRGGRRIQITSGNGDILLRKAS